MVVVNYHLLSAVQLGTDLLFLCVLFNPWKSFMVYDRWQNIPPPNMPLWHKNYLELKTLKTTFKKGILNSPFLPEYKISKTPMQGLPWWSSG